jgi:hypothetical protein
MAIQSKPYLEKYSNLKESKIDIRHYFRMQKSNQLQT